MKQVSLIIIFTIANTLAAISQQHKAITNITKAKIDSINAIPKSTGNLKSPALTVETSASFVNDELLIIEGETLNSTCNWRIDSKIICNDPAKIEVLPIYLYSKVNPIKSFTRENSKVICRKSFAHAFSEMGQNDLMIAPEQLVPEFHSNDTIAMDDLINNSPIELYPMIVDSVRYEAVLTVNQNLINWGKFSVNQHDTIKTNWEFGSIQYSDQIIDKPYSFTNITFLGPVVHSGLAPSGEYYLVAVRLKFKPNENGGNIKQTSVQFIKITHGVPKNIFKAFPNCLPCGEFGNAIIKLTAEMKF